MTEKTKKLSFSLPYLIFIILFTITAVIITGVILKSGNHHWCCKPAVNTYYIENISYPPMGAEKVGSIALLWGLIIFFIVDCFFADRLRKKKRILFVAISILFILSSTELSMSLYIRKKPPLHRPHPTFLWEVSPGINRKIFIVDDITVKTNKYGFRGPEIEKNKPDGVFRIMILGDSSAFGFAVNQDEVFASILQRKLQKKYPDKKIEVVNAAVMGYTTFSSLNFFREKGQRFNPDAIIISHNNDPDMDLDEDKNRVPPKYLQPLMKILYRSNIYMAIRREILNREYKNTPEIYKKISDGQGSRRVSPDDFGDNLQKIMDLAKKKGIKVIVVSMPRNDWIHLKQDPKEDEEDKDDDEDEDASIVKDHDDGPPGPWELVLYRGIMKEVTLKNGGTFVDMLYEWRDLPAESLFLDVMHPTKEGHEKIADRLYKVFVENNICEK